MNCARRLGRGPLRTVGFILALTFSSFSLGRFLRPPPPPLIIQRRTDSPLSDAPVEFNDSKSIDRKSSVATNQTDLSSDAVFICGARTQKGSPCHRRVHAAGERCFQHKGKPAMLPPEKLVIK